MVGDVREPPFDCFYVMLWFNIILVRDASHGWRVHVVLYVLQRMQDSYVSVQCVSGTGSFLRLNETNAARTERSSAHSWHPRARQATFLSVEKIVRSEALVAILFC